MRLTIHGVAHEAGAQRTEVIPWLAMRGALLGKVTKILPS